MRSPGAPSPGRATERRFWEQIAIGVTSERAAEAVGVSQGVGSRWFRHPGGMPLFMSKPGTADYYLRKHPPPSLTLGASGNTEPII